MRKITLRFKYFSALLITVLFLGLFIAIPNQEYAFASNIGETAIAESMLDENSRLLYGAIKEEILNVSSGNQSSTTFEISTSSFESYGIKRSWGNDEMGGLTFNADNVFNLFMNQFDLENIVQALMHDMPYELFWFDKTAGYLYTADILMSGGKIKIDKFIMIMRVTPVYKAKNYNANSPAVDSSKIATEQSIRTNAMAIINKYQNLSDYQKLLSYKNEICDLVSYDHNAVSPSYKVGYSNPWQLINVLHNDPSTNEVCEGYAKAFQYLCDLTTFNSTSIQCYTITGVISGATGSGNHMWNVVTMDDEKSYIVDVTNCDEGSIGYENKLFMTGTDGSIASGYTFNLINDVKYIYDSNTINLWGEQNTSVLALANTNYVEKNNPIIKIDVKTIVYDGLTPSIGFCGTNSDIEYTFENNSFIESDFDWNVEWFKDNNGFIGESLLNVPVDAGEYWVKISAINKTDPLIFTVNTKKIQIKRKQLSISAINIFDKIFDGNTNLTLNSISISGAIVGDDVKIDPSQLQVSSPNSVANEYNKVNLDNVILIGDDNENYTIDSSFINFDSNLYNISKRNLDYTYNFTKVTSDDKQLSDIIVSINAKGLGNIDISGSGCWIDDNGDLLSGNTIIEYKKNYKYKFIPDNENYNSFVIQLILWDENFFDNDLEILIVVNNFTYDNTSISAGGMSSESEIKYGFNNGSIDETLYNWVVEWFVDDDGQIGDKLSESPNKVGTYWIKVTATRKSDDFEIFSTMKFNILPKLLTITKVIGENRKFNNTDNIKVLSLELSGVIFGDNVDVDLLSASAKVSSSDVGEYDVVNLTNVLLVGESKDNYTILSSINNVVCEPIIISKATPNHEKTFDNIETTGKTLAEINIQLLVKGTNQETLSGYGCWIDENGNMLSDSTIIEQGIVYRYKFFTNDSNYEDIIITVQPWQSEEVGSADEKKMSLEQIINIVNYSLISLFTLIVGVSAIKAVKSIIIKNKKTEDN